jgi:hypothetical protein
MAGSQMLRCLFGHPAFLFPCNREFGYVFSFFLIKKKQKIKDNPNRSASRMLSGFGQRHGTFPLNRKFLS